MGSGSAVATGVVFVWLGMVLAISFLEAPLKFRAPDVTTRIGLGIGRLVFRALNGVEVVFAAAIVVVMALDRPSFGLVVPLVVAVAALVVQLLLVRPRLNRRSRAVLMGEDSPGSRAHHVYIGLEAIKVIALLVGGSLLLST